MVKFRIINRFEDCDGRKCGMGRHISGGRYLCSHNNLKVKYPELAEEWNYEKNEKGPENYLCRSGYRAQWKCGICAYEWTASIINRTMLKTGCSNCVGKIKWTLERFIKKASELHHNKYNYSLIKKGDIKNRHSHIPIKCNRCEYIWNSTINGHIYGKHGCSSCGGILPWTLERFIKKADEIHGDRFNYSLINKEDIENKGSHITIYCNKCTHIWRPTISSHINTKRGCPHCAVSCGYSQQQISWLERLEKEQNVKIQKATDSSGEFTIRSIGKVDGYCQETNTVYEFHGDFWHGNPNVFDPNDINTSSGEIFSVLYQRTLERDKRIKDLGYNLVVKWETEI